MTYGMLLPALAVKGRSVVEQVGVKGWKEEASTLGWKLETVGLLFN